MAITQDWLNTVDRDIEASGQEWATAERLISTMSYDAASYTPARVVEALRHLSSAQSALRCAVGNLRLAHHDELQGAAVRR